MAESADATDLKSVDGDIVRVRPPLAPQYQRKAGFLLNHEKSRKNKKQVHRTSQ